MEQCRVWICRDKEMLFKWRPKVHLIFYYRNICLSLLLDSKTGSLRLHSTQAPPASYKPPWYWLCRGLRCRDLGPPFPRVSSFPAQSGVRGACRLSARRYKLRWMSRVNLWYYSAVNGPQCQRASNTQANHCSDSSPVCACVCDVQTTFHWIMWQRLITLF